MSLGGINIPVVVVTSKSSTPRGRKLEEVFVRHPILTLEAWAEFLGGPHKKAQARDRAKYYCGTGRLRLLTRGLYAVVPPGADPEHFLPDPYLVAAALRGDAILSHHTALDLLGRAHSVFHLFPYLTRRPRRALRFGGMEWRAVAHPTALVKARKTDLGVVAVDRQGVVLRVTGAERTLVDGFMGLRWVGGLEEHVESAGGFRDLDLDFIAAYLKVLDQGILYAAVGWFLERYPEVADGPDAFLEQLEKQIPKRPLYLGGRQRGGRLEPRWNLVIPPHLTSDSGFEGTRRSYLAARR